MMSSFFTSLTPKKTEKEIALEKSGDLNALQHYRFDVHQKARYQDGPKLVRKFLKMESILQHNSQLEQDISEEPTLESEEFLQDLRADVWVQRRDLWLHRSEFTGALKRGLDLWRSDPSWYMHRVLVDDCRGRQGCCARDCGCCVKRQSDPKRKLEANHCTMTCRCCRLATDDFLGLSEEEIEAEEKSSEPFYRKNFYHEFEMASIWGISSDSDCSPFDQIERAPEHRDDREEEHRSPSLHGWDSDSTMEGEI